MHRLPTAVSSPGSCLPSSGQRGRVTVTAHAPKCPVIVDTSDRVEVVAVNETVGDHDGRDVETGERDWPNMATDIPMPERSPQSSRLPTHFAGELALSIEFLLTSLIVVVSPGVGVLYTLAAGLARGAGRRGGGVRLHARHRAAHGGGDPGAGGVAAHQCMAFQALKYLGVAYLLWMAWSTLREHGALRVEQDVAPKAAGRVIVEAVLLNLFNPKLSIFFLAFLPQFVTRPSLSR